MSPINKRLFESSVRHVRRELRTMKFGKRKIMKTKVSRTLLPSITKKGYFTDDGQIFIPILQSKRGVRDILRHEYGHALLFHYPSIRTKKGYTYFGHTSDPNDYISNYAMSDPEEDFCETFMVYIKNRGEIQRQKLSPVLMEKWRFITALKRSFGSSL